MQIEGKKRVEEISSEIGITKSNQFRLVLSSVFGE